MWQYIGFFGEIGLYLMGLVNGKISDKMKLEYATVRAYSQKKTEIEKDLIKNGVNWYSFFETCDFIKKPSQEDLEFIKTLSNQDLLDMLIILGLAMKGYIDAYEDKNSNCLLIHEFYLLLKKEIELRPNRSFMPKGDGFVDYLESRKERKELIDRKQNVRIKGNFCIFCEGSNIRSNGNMWKCLDCERQFRKSSV
jgi:hypothetical protein